MMIDSHIHLSHKYYNQLFPYIDFDRDGFHIVPEGRREGLIAEMKSRGITGCIEPSIGTDSNELLLSLCKSYEGFLYPAVGNHPTRCIHSPVGDFKKLREYAKTPGIVAIGETGLDYHYDRKDQHRLKQKIWFWYLIRLADKQGLPLILHIRNADEDGIRILRKNKARLHGGVCHCFCGGSDVAGIYTKELGLCLGIGGTLLMKPEISAPLEQAVRETDLRFLLLETDGPYVKPQKPDGIIGKRWSKARNTSLILPAVARKIAGIKGISEEEVLNASEENARRVFGLKKN